MCVVCVCVCVYVWIVSYVFGLNTYIGVTVEKLNGGVCIMCPMLAEPRVTLVFLGLNTYIGVELEKLNGVWVQWFNHCGFTCNL